MVSAGAAHGDRRLNPVPACVSVLVPAYNEEANVERLFAAVTSVFAWLPDYDYEIIFTDNH